MHSNHPMPHFRNTLTNLKPPLSTDNTTLSCCVCQCHNQLCTKQPVPSQREVQDAMSSLQEFMRAASSSSTVQQISGSYGQRIVNSHGYKRLYDAFQLLQDDPAIKRLVVSLSSDKTLWDAVMSKVLHQKLLELPDSAESRRPQIPELNEIGIHVLSWTLDIIKGKILELIESFQSLVNDLFQCSRMENTTTDDATELDEKVRSSFLLSIVILLIVIVARSQRF